MFDFLGDLLVGPLLMFAGPVVVVILFFFQTRKSKLDAARKEVDRLREENRRKSATQN
jgi:hypothetical protein